MGHACIAFGMDDPREAYAHISRNAKRVAGYGDWCNGHSLHTWDDGSRSLLRCDACGGYLLLQLSEFHGLGHDCYYVDYFPLSGPEEAEGLNATLGGFEIERRFDGRWLNADRPSDPHWVFTRPADGDADSE